MSDLREHLAVMEVTPLSGDPYRSVFVVYARSPEDAAAAAEAIGKKADRPLETRLLGVHPKEPPKRDDG